MTKKQELELLSKFETIKRWMIDDIRKAMFLGTANILAAQGLLIYTEIIGSLITGEGDGHSGENFDAFFARLGKNYETLLKKHNGKRKLNPHVLYDDLRCGLVHEYLVKRKGFVIYNASHKLSDPDIEKIKTVDLDGKKIGFIIGVVFARDSKNKDYWLIINPLYWLHFKKAIDKYWQEICDENNKVLREKFFKRIKEVNIKNFNV